MYGQRIKDERQLKGLSQKQLAEMISTTQSTIGKYEREELQPNIDVITKLCEIFECSADYLLGLSDD
ncbi:MAG: helix-turn-helix domain-containing protein [Clostridia bacterium]|nr:helix-turn-helix domain-containing protein [Clostridia bacterium]